MQLTTSTFCAHSHSSHAMAERNWPHDQLKDALRLQTQLLPGRSQALCGRKHLPRWASVIVPLTHPHPGQLEPSSSQCRAARVRLGSVSSGRARWGGWGNGPQGRLAEFCNHAGRFSAAAWGLLVRGDGDILYEPQEPKMLWWRWSSQFLMFSCSQKSWGKLGVANLLKLSIG
jgi:hypothetical protein